MAKFAVLLHSETWSLRIHLNSDLIYHTTAAGN